jgi:hypothetical protein
MIMVVESPCAQPTGSVTFLSDGSPIGTATVGGGGGLGLAGFSTNTLTGGTHTVVAQYNGDNRCNPSTSSPLSQVVTMVDSTTVVTSAVNPSWVGQTVIFTATVQPASPVSPTGSVTFVIDGSPVDTIALSDALATFSTNTLPAGPHTVVAQYTGDISYNSSSGSLPGGQLVVGIAHDYNGDGEADLLWRDTTGNVAMWLMNGSTVISSGGLGNIPTNWSIVGQRNFNGDGKADLLWRDTSGNVAMWFMNGAAVASTGSVGNIPTNWSVAGVADFNGDGKGDLLWRDTAGDIAVWLMNGATVTSSAGLDNLPAASWTVVGTGDFNGDGKADILWQDNLGNTSIWFMNGAAVASTGSVGNIPTNWSVVGTGDFNGDGKSDIVWSDTAGDTAIWLMNAAAVSSAGGLGSIGAIVQTGDYNGGGGVSDLFWRDTSGNTSMWFMDGASALSFGTVGNIPTNWTVQSVNAE